MTKISSFTGKNNFLSNFFFSPFVAGNFTYQTNEHFYQANKATYKKDHLIIVRAKTPLECKRLGRRIRMRTDWEDVKLDIMWKGLKYKFSDKKLQLRLIETHPLILEEGNWWNDTFWGVDSSTGKGQNHLGRLLMRLRELYLQ